MKKGRSTVALESVCREITDGSHFSPPIASEGFPYITVRDIEDEQIDFENCKRISPAHYKELLKNGCKPNKGDVLFSKDGTVGKVAHVDFKRDFVVLSSLAIIRPDSARLDSAFLKYVMLSPSFLEAAVGMKTGAAIRRIILRNLKSIRIPVPPLPEQQRIVGILDEAFESIATAKANTEKKLQNAHAIFESYLQSVFTQRGEGWVEKKLSEVCAITSTLVDPRKDEFLDLIHVGAGNIESQTGVFVELKTAREEGLISGKFPFDNSMVLYSKIRPYLMKVARPHFRGLCSADIYPLAPLPNQITRDYLFHLLLSKRFTEYAIQGSARAGMPKVNREHLFEFSVWLPTVKRQQELAATLSDLREETQRLESIYQQKLTALEALKKSLLHQAFSGEL